jgi:DHA1 family bicyclomycin/chloramphenicol resistance-like MFS transporter
MLTLFGPLAIDMYLPALPRISSDLRASTSSVQLSLTACFVGLAVGQLVIGAASDRFGRKRPLGVGLLLFIGASLACAFAPGIALLIACRVLQGIGGSAGMVISTAVVRDLFSGTLAAVFFSRIFLVMGVGPLLAPQIGAELLRVSSWRGIFVALAILGAVLLTLVLTELPETLAPHRRQHGGLSATRRSVRALLADRPFLANALCGGFAIGVAFAYVAGSSFVLENLYGLSPQAYGLVFAANGMGVVAASQANARLVVSVGPARMLSVGVVALLSAAVWLLLAVLAMPGDLAAVLPPLLFVTASFALIGSNTRALALNDFPNSAGSASAILGVIQFAIGALVAPLVGISGSHDALPMAVVITCLAAAALACRIWTPPSTARLANPIADADLPSQASL